jgi:hypothetical protein
VSEAGSQAVTEPALYNSILSRSRPFRRTSDDHRIDPSAIMWAEVVTGVRVREYFETVNPDGDTIRVRFATDHGEVLWYTVQFEVYVEGRY